jgi:hypothetical protein
MEMCGRLVPRNAGWTYGLWWYKHVGISVLMSPHALCAPRILTEGYLNDIPSHKLFQILDPLMKGRQKKSGGEYV